MHLALIQMMMTSQKTLFPCAERRFKLAKLIRGVQSTNITQNGGMRVMVFFFNASLAGVNTFK